MYILPPATGDGMQQLEASNCANGHPSGTGRVPQLAPSVRFAANGPKLGLRCRHVAYLTAPDRRRLTTHIPHGTDPHPGRRSSMSERSITVERVYDHPGAEAGIRVFVDRLWPRGLRKDSFYYDDWAKDLAPSTELRRWYSHDVALFSEFRDRVLEEMRSAHGREAVDRLDKIAGGRPIILLTATKDLEHSGAVVLAEYLRSAG